MIKLSTFLFLITLLFTGCGGCSKSGRINKNNSSRNTLTYVNPKVIGKTRIKMVKQDGVYKIPVTINGKEMYFIFDTGAGLISISNTEATYLYKQGRLSKDDIIGKANFMDANGDISEGQIIRLREVTIGNKTLTDIDASVVNNSKAPLLFGQSALEKFGKISIDYENGEIIFE